MVANLSFPVHHLSMRVPWHDSGWNGVVCMDPVHNTACLKLKQIAENKDEASESSVAGRAFTELPGNALPPCLRERSAFMSPHGLVSSVPHPYQRTAEASHGHFRPTPLNYPSYSAPGIPFRWMLKESTQELRRHYPLEEVDEGIEPDLGFSTAWWQHRQNHIAILDTFWAHIKVEDSLIFFYAKQVPLIEDVAGQRVLVGVGRVKSVGPLTEYQYDGPTDGKLRSMLWERMVGHSIRPDFADGFLLPYHEALERCQDGEAFDPAAVVALTPEDRFTEFSYATEHVGDDSSIEALLSMRTSLMKCEELFGADIGKQEAWIDQEVGRLWRKRGPFPGMGVVLTANGVPMGNFIARGLGDHAGNDSSPWSVWFSALDSPDKYLPPALAKCVDRTIAQSWKAMPPERWAFFELLSRVDLTQEQAEALVRRGEGRDFVTSLTANPYLLYESTRLSDKPVSINAVDRGLSPASSIRAKFPLPHPSRVDTPVDARRLRALSIRELEAAADQGDTLVQRENIVERLRQRNNSNDDDPTMVTGDLLKVAEDTLFADEVRIVHMADGAPAYQLERLGTAGDLIRKTVNGRAGGKRHGLVFDWRGELDKILEDLPIDSTEANIEERARGEKAAALGEIANARISVLVGSAGTGKTTLLSALCKHPEIQKNGVILLAPTGKARVQLEGSKALEGIKAYTIAQFLTPSGRYDGSTQRYTLTGRPGESRGRTIIIDECSMLTEEMLAALLEALAGIDRLILVGDPRQLPPIGPGRPFVDIISRLRPDSFAPDSPRAAPSYAELMITRRQRAKDESDTPGHVLDPEAMTEPRDRDDLDLASWFGGEPGPGDDRVFEVLTDHRQSETVKVVHWETADELGSKLPQVIADQLGFDKNQDEGLQFSQSLGGQISGQYAYFNRGRSGAKAEAWQILSPSRQKPWGVEPLNRSIHQRYKSKQIESATHVPPFRQRRFLKPQGDELIVYGDKVINNRNQHVPKSRRWPSEEGYIANGEVGMVVGQMRNKNFNHTPRYLQIEFSTQPASVVNFWPSSFDEERGSSLELAYALTVHKAQGSEFGTVLLVLPKSGRMISRELIYTALTRQKDKIVLLMQGSTADLQRFSSDLYSDTARRLTNLFAAPSPVAIGDKFLEGNLIHRTARGEAVRSKSEVIIADLLHAKGIDYRYEEPLERNGVTKYPDFTIEDDNAGETYYWEHLGMLGNPTYQQRWNEKLTWLKGQGIFPKEEGGGPNGTLVITRDSADGGIDAKAVSELIQDLFGV